MTRLTIVHAVLALLAAVGIAGCGGSETSTPTAPATPATRIIRGSLLALDPGPNIDGSEIRVLDGSGNVIGVTTGGVSGCDAVPESCVAYFQVSVTPASFYVFEINGRTGPTYSSAQMEEMDYLVEYISP